MTAFLRSLPPRRRTATLLGWGLLIASPFLLLAAIDVYKRQAYCYEDKPAVSLPVIWKVVR